MEDFRQLVEQGSLHAWIYIPTAILLGALHGLEPGHSKTMMVAFIIAIRGTIFQAVLLGLCAAFSHSLVIWLLAGLALHYGNQWNAESTEPYFQMGSAAVIIGLALWMAWRTHRDIQAEARHHHDHSHAHPAIPADYQDAHELAHADEIRQQFGNGTASPYQIALFGLTGGLLPCPAAFTIVLVCLQLKRFVLGITMVLAFSAGLAFTLVAVGVVAAWSLRHAEKHFGGLGTITRKLPYLSSGLLTLLGLFIGIQGWLHLPLR